MICLTHISTKDALTFGLTVWGLVIATRGLSTWKKQTKGVKEFEASYNLNYSILKLRNAIKSVRNPAIWPSESRKADLFFKEKYPDRIDEAESHKKSTAYVYEMRWEEISEAYTEMESHLLAIEVLWGSDILKKVKPLKEKVSRLNMNLRHYFDPNMRELKKAEEIDNIVYDMGHDENEDAFSQEVTAAIKEITDYIKEKME